jgi:protein-S-isoprenylcysteine O-methyltransferase Ste14
MHHGSVTVFRHVRAVVLLPGLVVVAIPALIVWWTGSVRVGWGLPLALAWLPVLVGAGLVELGLTLVVRTILLLARVGRGTLAPWDATSRLVVRGPYRFVRNPMITGVVLTLLGEAALLGSPAILIWAAVVFALNAAYLPLVEERSLSRRFGADYDCYRQNVPRWLPRLRPWDPRPERTPARADFSPRTR